MAHPGVDRDEEKKGWARLGDDMGHGDNKVDVKSRFIFCTLKKKILLDLMKKSSCLGGFFFFSLKIYALFKDSFWKKKKSVLEGGEQGRG